MTNRTVWFVSRHAGAIEWAKRKELAIDRWVTHLVPSQIASGDVIIGTLPVHLAAVVCGSGARYFHLSFEAPMDWRGRELSVSELITLSARIEPYHVQRSSGGCAWEVA